MIKIRVIGKGSIGKNHVRVCSDINNIQFSGIVETDKKTAKTVAEKLKTKMYGDYNELLQKVVDAVIIATPDNSL